MLKKVVILSSFVLLLVLTGCNKETEIDDKSFVGILVREYDSNDQLIKSENDHILWIDDNKMETTDRSTMIMLEDKTIKTNYLADFQSNLDYLKFTPIYKEDEQLIYEEYGHSRFAPGEVILFESFSFNKLTNSTEFNQIQFEIVDIDIIKEITIVQYNENHEKIYENQMIGNIKGDIDTKVVLSKDIHDFKVIVDYYNDEEKDFQKRTLYTKDDINEKQIYRGFDEEGHLRTYQLEFVIE